MTVLEPIRITVIVSQRDAPALRSAIEELSSDLADRMARVRQFHHEAALTRAVSGVGLLRRAVCAAIPRPDPDYTNRDGRRRRDDDTLEYGTHALDRKWANRS